MRGKEFGNSGGEAASLREAPLPQPPLSKSGWGFSWSVLLTWFPLPVGYAPFQVVASTAADRAAADMRGKEYGDSGGEAASLREAPLPRPPLPKSSRGFSWPFLLTWFPLPVGYAPFQLVASTAADRAAADVRGKEYGNSGGEAAFLREAPLPRPPSPEERLGFQLVGSPYLIPPASWIRSVPVSCVHGG